MFFTKIRLEEAIVNKYFLVFIKSTTNFCALWPGQKIIVNKNAIKPSFPQKWGKFRKTLWNGECFGEFGLFCGEFRKKFSSHTAHSSEESEDERYDRIHFSFIRSHSSFSMPKAIA